MPDEMLDTHLVPSLVSDEDYERPVVLLDIVVNEDRYPRVELLSHLCRGIIQRDGKIRLWPGRCAVKPRCRIL